jgi:histidine triad (HIT) family protein
LTGSSVRVDDAAAVTQPCVFCAIERGEVAAPVVFADARTMAFLDHRPVFPGHTLLIPRAHHETLTDLPWDLLEPVFGAAQVLARAVRDAMGADGTFVAMNNTVSQSVPHMHVHIVPRRRKDGLRGFFWPRTRYPSDEALEATRRAIADAATGLR